MGIVNCRNCKNVERDTIQNMFLWPCCPAEKDTAISGQAAPSTVQDPYVVFFLKLPF